MRKRAPLAITCSVAPGNNQFVVVFDSTRGLAGTQDAVASGNARLVPLGATAGGRRDFFAGAAIRYSALCTSQNVTLLLQDLTGVGGVSGDWENQGSAGSVTITAGTTSTGEFKPLTPDFRVVVQAGATGPATCVVKLTITWGEDYGS